jgi:hypothetical protein
MGKSKLEGMRGTLIREHAKPPAARQGDFVKNFTSALLPSLIDAEWS